MNTKIGALKEYGFAVLCSSLGLIVIYLGWNWLGELLFLVTVFLAILVTWHGGWGPGLASVLLFIGGFNVLFMQLDGRLDLADAPVEGILLAVTLLLAVAAAARWREQEAATYLAALARSSEDAFISLRLDGTITRWNRGAEKLFGYTSQEVKNRNIALLVPPDRMGEFRALNQKLCARETIDRHDTIRLRQDGRPVHVSLTAVPVCDWRGRVLGITAISRDITERVQAQQLLEQRVEERTSQLSALYQVTAVASSSLELHVILDQSLSAILDVMDSTMGMIQILEEDGHLHIAGAHGIPPDILRGLDGLELDHGLAAWVFEHGQPLLVPDLTLDGRTISAARELGPRAYVGVPIAAKGKLLGVLHVLREAGRPFEAGEAKLLVSIGCELGVAVENARLYQHARENAVLQERQRLASELHDSIAQSLYTVMLLSGTARHWIEVQDLAHADKDLSRLGDISRQVLKEMRLILYELRRPALTGQSLAEALEKRLDAVERRSGIDARLVVEGTDLVEPEAAETLFTIAQEALNNALQHAQADRVTVEIDVRPPQIELSVTDNGKGFDREAMAKRGGWGLADMRQRAASLGGDLMIESSPNRGTRVMVCICQPEAAAPSGRDLVLTPAEALV